MDRGDAVALSKRPKSSAFRQQRLGAWQPILTAGTVLPTFFLVGLAFIPIGILLFLFSEGVKEVQIDYTNCLSVHRTNVTCKDQLEDDLRKGVVDRECKCEVNFTLESEIPGIVYVYYGLSNYYQNHRRYVKSRSDEQLRGSPRFTSKDCVPFRYGANETPVAPCGAIANSLFNDSIEIDFKDKDGFKTVELLKKDISWATDRKLKFRNPDDGDYNGTVKPPAWRKTIQEIGGFPNEALIVWMRTAALPTFRKLYGYVNHNLADWEERLPKGEYRARIIYNYPVAKFKGTKRVIISNTSWFGGKNPFLGIAYMTVGSLCLVLGAIFLFVHHKFGKNTRDLIAITGRTPY